MPYYRFLFIIFISSFIAFFARAQSLSPSEVQEFVGEANKLKKECVDNKDGKRCGKARFLHFAGEVGKEDLKLKFKVRELELQNKTLKAFAAKKPTAKLPPETQCRYPEILTDELEYLGIDPAGGGPGFNMSSTSNGPCYATTSRSMGRKVFACENQRGLFIRNEGGSPSEPDAREEDILFNIVDGKKCNITEIGIRTFKGKKQISEPLIITYDACLELDKKFSPLNPFKEVVGSSDKVAAGKLNDEARLYGLCLARKILPVPKYNAPAPSGASKTRPKSDTPAVQ